MLSMTTTISIITDLEYQTSPNHSACSNSCVVYPFDSFPIPSVISIDSQIFRSTEAFNEAEIAARRHITHKRHQGDESCLDDCLAAYLVNS